MQNNSTAWLYWFVLILYGIIVIMVGILIWLRDRKKDPEMDNKNFWSAGSKLSGWSIGLSISASMMSVSWSCVYGVQLFYWYGIGGAWLLIIPWLVTMSGFFLFTPMFRKMKAFSQPELLQNRFGGNIRQLLAIPLILVFITWAGAEIYAAANIIAPFLSVSPGIALFLIALIVAIYSFTGGFEAVVSTDKIQFFLVAFFIATIAILALNYVTETTSIFDWLTAIPVPPKSVSGNSPFSPGITLILVTFFAYLPGWLIETDVWLRLQASRSDREARKGVTIAAFNSFVFVGIFPLTIGLAALTIYPPVDGAIPERIHDGALIFTALMQDFATPWLNVFLTLGLIAAAMSTVDTCGNVVAVSLSFDLLEPSLSKKWNARKMNNFARWMSVLAILLAYIYSLFTESLWDIFYFSSGILTTTVFLPVLASFHPQTQKRQMQFSIISGFVGTLVFYFLESRQILSGVEPETISGTGLGYILWGFLSGVVGFFVGKIKQIN